MPGDWDVSPDDLDTVDYTPAAAAKKPTRGGKKARPAADEPTALPTRAFRCHVPADRTLPTITVEAVTAADAEKKYKDAAGIISTPHPVAAEPIAADADADGETD